MLERQLQAEMLLMDGIFENQMMRGRGVGSALLSPIKEKALFLDCSKVRLDLIGTIPRARALYERHGFVPEGTSNIGPLRHILGFRAATTMFCEV